VSRKRLSAVNAADLTLVPLRPTGRDLDEVAAVAARAFHIDPFFEWLEPGELRRARALGLFFRTMIRNAGPGVEVTGARRADGRLVGVAVWIAPSKFPPPVAAQVRSLLGSGWALALRPERLVPGTRYVAALDRAHPREPMWYLQVLATDPIAQRRGVGATLLGPGHERADREGLDCWLETQKEDNIVYYRRFGWEVAGELRPVSGGPPLWTMRRPSRH